MSESKDSSRPGSGQKAAVLPKRIYRTATVAPAGSGYGVRLDDKPLRTPAKAVLALPTSGLAHAIAAEWQAQGERIDPASMPLTRVANSAFDGVLGREAEVRADIARYADSDLLCHRAETPPELVRRQAESWDPILDWSRAELGVAFSIARGIMPVTQPEAGRIAIARALAPYDGFALAALHVMTTLMGSALLALAHARGAITVEAAWAAAHVDEDWQISQWGEDAEAAARRGRRWREMRAASQLLELLGAARAGTLQPPFC